MKKLIIEIEQELEDGDIEAFLKLAPESSLYWEIGKPHSNSDLGDMGIAECFAIDITQFTVRIVDDEK